MSPQRLLLLSIVLMILPASALTLNQALELGRQRSTRLESPKLDRLKVEGQIAEAWSNALPQVDGQVGYQRAWKKAPSLPTMTDNAAFGEATLSQPIYTFGKVGAGLKAAYAAKRANEHFTIHTQRSTDLAIAKSFWQVLLLREVVGVRRNGLAISDSALQNMKRLRNVGLMSDFDVLRSQVQLNNQKPQLLESENALKLAEMAFREIIGVPLDTLVTPEGTFEQFVADTLSLDVESLRQKVAIREDIEALRDVTTMQENVYRIYNNMKWPSIGAQVKYNWGWGNNVWAINPMNNASSVTGAIAVQVPIWTSMKNSGRAQQYLADWKKSKLNLTDAERGARLQFESAVSNYETARLNEVAAYVSVDQAEQARQIAQTKLQQGQLTPLEMDAVQLDESVAKVALAQAKYNRLVAGAETRMAAGLPPCR